MHHGHAEMSTWIKLETGSRFTWHHQMKVWRISASISVTITDIWTNLVQNTNTTLSTRRNSRIHITWKSKLAAAAILNFRKMLITPDWIKISAPNFMGRCIMAMWRWSRDQKSKPKFIRMRSSNEGLKDKCVDLGDYNSYLNQIWYRTQIPHYQHAGIAEFT